MKVIDEMPNSEIINRIMEYAQKKANNSIVQYQTAIEYGAFVGAIRHIFSNIVLTEEQKKSIEKSLSYLQ